MIIMKLNKHALERLLYEHFGGNFTRLSKELRIDVSHVHKVIEKEKGCGAKFLNSIIRWCQENDKDYREFIFLP
jgi:energy-converting hydrogenase A subunit M